MICTQISVVSKPCLCAQVLLLRVYYFVKRHNAVNSKVNMCTLYTLNLETKQLVSHVVN